VTVSLFDATGQPTLEELTAILTDPDTLAGKHLPQAEQDEHRRCVESIVAARAYAEAHAYEWVIWR
jgi:hypothetical protein